MRTLFKKAFVFFINHVVVGVFRRVHHNVFWGNLLLSINKTAGFLEDPTFARCLKAIEGSHQYDAYHAPDSIAWRLHTLVWAAQNAAMLEGDFVECGVFKGDFAWVITEMLGFATLEKTFFLYDSFAGFSEGISSPEDFPDEPDFYAKAQEIYSEPSLYPSVQQRFSTLPNVQVIKGFVPEVFAVTVPEKIAFLHVDLNSPNAERAALDALFRRVVTGGYVVFDDYGWFAARKQKEAIDGFFAPLGYHVLELPTGQGLVIKR
ncbi:MAG: TylF/MycF/NovP-related O-methyltransferase [Alphaproteobacteria bacterium]|nr:TylF/MycF/NovP-related O-methyltransferase [Alphaproteobacteria bacterium]